MAPSGCVVVIAELLATPHGRLHRLCMRLSFTRSPIHDHRQHISVFDVYTSLGNWLMERKRERKLLWFRNTGSDE
ncbi:hypothetical protein BJV77DRAFT_1070213 [Russula vinacea]|nr:hypothetical protein BJV77DRAFT_1070213 [Russula vinacea]